MSQCQIINTTFPMSSPFFSYQHAILRKYIGEDVHGDGVAELAIKKVKVFLPACTQHVVYSV